MTILNHCICVTLSLINKLGAVHDTYIRFLGVNQLVAFKNKMPSLPVTVDPFLLEKVALLDDLNLK